MWEHLTNLLPSGPTSLGRGKPQPGAEEMDPIFSLLRGVDLLEKRHKPPQRPHQCDLTRVSRGDVPSRSFTCSIQLRAGFPPVWSCRCPGCWTPSALSSTSPPGGAGCSDVRLAPRRPGAPPLQEKPRRGAAVVEKPSSRNAVSPEWRILLHQK